MTASPPAIAIRDLEFRWPGTRGVEGFSLKLPSLAVNPENSLFLHGPSGSGKSTLLNLIGGVLTPQSGRIELLGQPFSALGAARRDAFRADHVGFIFQQFNLIPYLSVLDNVLLPCRFSARRAAQAGDAEAAAQALLEHLAIAPDLHHRPAHTLSVGQQQRVAAARALIGKPEILIADEPTSALDAARQVAFVDLLLSEARANRSALIFVSHDLRLAAHFDACLELAA
jgi:putative ABC transport system ATP-binding protein